MARIGLSLAGLLLALLTVECGTPPLRPHDGDDVPAARLLGHRIAREFTLEDGYYVSPRLEAPNLATRVGFMIDVTGGALGRPLYPEARALDAQGHTGTWLPSTFSWEEHPYRVANVDLDRVAVAIQIRVPAIEVEAYALIQWSAFVPMPQTSSPWQDDEVTLRNAGSAQRALASAMAQGGVKSRADWGARATRCSSTNTTKTKMTVHHTVTATDAGGSYPARLRQIQAYHMDSRGYCDIGYHFLVTLDGRQWEGRPARYLGAHVANHNTNNIGISFVGCFHSSECSSFPPNDPPAVMIEGGGHLVGLLASQYGIAINSSKVVGHRDLGSTACPGSYLYARLGDIRSIASSGGSTTPAPTTGSVKGVVWDLSVTAGPNDSGNQRITSARVASSSGASTGARDGDAYWSFELPAGSYTMTATADGYSEGTRSVQVTAGAEVWASIGLAQLPTSAEVSFLVFDAEQGVGATLEGAEVQVSGQAAQQTDAQGLVVITLDAGQITARASMAGYEPLEQTAQVVAGEPLRVELGLTPVVVPEPEPEPEPEPGEEPGKPPVDPNGPGTGGAQEQERPADLDAEADRELGLGQGCTCASDSAGSARGLILLALSWLLWRPRRRPS